MPQLSRLKNVFRGLNNFIEVVALLNESSFLRHMNLNCKLIDNNTKSIQALFASKPSLAENAELKYRVESTVLYAQNGEKELLARAIKIANETSKLRKELYQLCNQE